MERWILEPGRTIRTPDGSFYLTYGKDKHGNPLFKDFCKLDAIAHQVAALPELLAEITRLRQALMKARGEQACDKI